MSLLVRELNKEIDRLRAQVAESIPVERVRAAIRALWPDEITPVAKRVLETLCDEYEPGGSDE